MKKRVNPVPPVHPYPDIPPKKPRPQPPRPKKDARLQVVSDELYRTMRSISEKLELSRQEDSDVVLNMFIRLGVVVGQECPADLEKGLRQIKKEIGGQK